MRLQFHGCLRHIRRLLNLLLPPCLPLSIPRKSPHSHSSRSSIASHQSLQAMYPCLYLMNQSTDRPWFIHRPIPADSHWTRREEDKIQRRARQQTKCRTTPCPHIARRPSAWQQETQFQLITTSTFICLRRHRRAHQINLYAAFLHHRCNAGLFPKAHLPL